MSFTVTVKPSFLSDLVRTPRRITNRVTQVTQELGEDPVRGGGNIKKLLGFRNLYRYRIDDHRLVYSQERL
jgi:mRNA-degrading endonuclease RelE of RelBE toxin-antitoxin system